MPEQVLTVKEVADYLAVNERVVEELLDTGLLKGSRRGDSWEVKESDLLEYEHQSSGRGVV
ncbi:MAG TPA: helix-turn-helix domain-containing protein [Methanomicrobiales archaeon]|nr:helix-turn-helix domain-containing protein [Methanomicrobiales archaeon]